MGTQTQLLRVWHAKAERASRGHYLAAERAKVWERIWTCVNMLMGVATAILGAGPFDLTSPLASGIFVVIGGVALTSSMWQIIFNFGEMAARHKRAAADYANAGRRIEYLFTASVEKEDIEALRIALDDLNGISPELPGRIFNSLTVKALTEKTQRAKQLLFGDQKV